MTAFALSVEISRLPEELTEVHISPLFALSLPFTPNDPPWCPNRFSLKPAPTSLTVLVFSRQVLVRGRVAHALEDTDMGSSSDEVPVSLRLLPRMAKLQGLHGLRLATHRPVVCPFQETVSASARKDWCGGACPRKPDAILFGSLYDVPHTAQMVAHLSRLLLFGILRPKGCVGAWSCPEFMPDARTGSKDAVSTLRAKRLEAGTLGINFVR